MFTEEDRRLLYNVFRKRVSKGKSLSEKFHVSEDCIRKDLKTLENSGKLKRTYGGRSCLRITPPERRY